VKILRLQESVELSSGKVVTLLDVLNGVSLDYAVVAQKTGEAEILAATGPAFEAEYGLTLETIAIRYAQQAEAKAQQTETMAQQAEAKAQQAEAKAQQTETMAQQAATWFFRRGLKPTREDVVAAYQCFLRREPENESVVLGHMQIKTVGKLINCFMSSKEFRILMNPNASAQSEPNPNPFFPLLRLPKRIAKPLIVWVMRKALANPSLKTQALNILAKHPQLKQRLREVAMQSGLNNNHCGDP